MTVINGRNILPGIMLLNEKEIFTFKEIAAMKGQSIQAVQQLARRRKIMGKKVGFIRVFSRHEMERFLLEEVEVVG